MSERDDMFGWKGKGSNHRPHDSKKFRDNFPKTMGKKVEKASKESKKARVESILKRMCRDSNQRQVAMQNLIAKVVKPYLE